MSKHLILAATLAAFAAPAFAQTAATDEVNQRAANQQQRINQGEQTGQLTPKESARLEKKQNHLDKKIAKDEAKNGGSLTPSEAKHINAQENRDSKAIYNQKHDAQTTAPVQ